MKHFSQNIIEYIQSQRVGVLAVEMLDGSPHAATVHFAYDPITEKFFFETYRDYRKAEPLFGNKFTRASFVIGQNEDNPRTLQLDGVVELIVEEEEKNNFEKIYFGKFPDKREKYASDSKFVIFSFSSNWWRFTDWTGPNGKEIILSTDK